MDPISQRNCARHIQARNLTPILKLERSSGGRAGDPEVDMIGKKTELGPRKAARLQPAGEAAPHIAADISDRGAGSGADARPLYPPGDRNCAAAARRLKSAHP